MISLAGNVIDSMLENDINAQRHRKSGSKKQKRAILFLATTSLVCGFDCIFPVVLSKEQRILSF